MIFKRKLILKKKYSISLLVLSMILVFIVVLGTSYAFFTTTVKGKDFIIYTGTLAVNYSKKTDVINIDNLYPMTNTEGLNLTPHEFIVTNDGNINARYQVRLELDNSINDMIPIEYIKLSYSIDGSSYSEPVLLSDLDSSLSFIRNIQLAPTKSNTIGIKLWIDLNAPNEVQGKEFKAKVVVDSIQDVEDGYVFDTVPIIYLNKDSSGNQDMIIDTNSTYTELGVNRVLDDKQVFTSKDATITYQYYDGINTTTVDSIDTTKTGIYYITYSITDSDNNIGKAVRVVAVGDSESLNIYHDIDSVVASFDSTSLKEVIMCSYIDGNDRMYFDCRIHDTIENALASKTKGSIIMTSDIERDNTITINSDKEIVLELNGKKITLNDTFVTNYGNLNVIDSSEALGKISSNATVFHNRENATLELSNVNVLSTNTESGSAICTGGKLIINDGTYVEGVYGIGCHTSNTALTIVNGGTIIGNLKNGINLNSSYSSEVIVNNGYIEGEAHGLANYGIGDVKIFGGIISSNKGSGVLNSSIGTIDISQTDKPLYITSLAQEWQPAVRNNSTTGIININGNEANNCTDNASDTTSGLCIYVEGDKNYESNTSNTAIANTGNGIINISGGTIYGGYIGISNHYDGTINITGGLIKSRYYGVVNNRTGTINLNSGIVSSDNGTAVYNAEGIININQIDKPLYITSLAQGWKPAINNKSTGTININGNEADNCTADPDDTTSGLCVYAEGDKNYETNTSNGAVRNSLGIVNIYGGTFYGGHQGINNTSSGIINIKNGNINSGKWAVLNNDTGTINICNAKINSLQYDIWASANSTGLINYSSNVMFTSGDNNPATGGITANIVPNYTGTCVSE